MHRFLRCHAGALFVAMVLVVPPSVAESLAERLRTIAADHDFILEGMEKIGDEVAVPTAGGLAAELRLLLKGYNHVVEGVPPSVQRVIILSAKVPAAHKLVADIIRNNGQDIVNVRLQGVAGRNTTLPLIIDTGASTLVLPESMMASLGFRADDLEQRLSQTANGKVTGRVGSLASVVVGSAVARDVAVLFVADERLGGVSLLGMSFLDRFSVTIDKADSKLFLTPRQ